MAMQRPIDSARDQAPKLPPTRSAVAVLLVVAGAMAAAEGRAATLMLMQHNNGVRAGVQTETILNTTNVRTQTFGKIFTRVLPSSTIEGLPKDRIYTQPLIAVGRKGQKIVIVATHSNKVYAFDAETPAASAPVWVVDLGPPEVSKHGDWPDDHCNDTLPANGVLGTPVIVPGKDTSALYVVSKNRSGKIADHTVFFQIHKIDIASGTKVASANLPKASVPGFDPYLQLQRASLAWVPNAKAPGGGYVYAGFGGHCDASPFHGWVFGFDGNLQNEVAHFNTSPDGLGAGIWQASQGPVHHREGSEDFLYVVTGNSPLAAPAKLANSVVKLRVESNGGLTQVDAFTPYNQAALNLCDVDLASAGPTLVDGKFVVLGGKEGVLYVLASGKLGQGTAAETQTLDPTVLCVQNNGGGGLTAAYQWNSNGDAVFQEFKATKGHIHGSPVHVLGWDGKVRLYVWSEEDNLKAFTQLGTGKFSTTPVESTVSVVSGMPGGAMSLSSGVKARGGLILWATHPDGEAWDPPNLKPIGGTLFAFDGTDVSKLLWSSDQDAADKLGEYSKFTPPTVSDGRVYVATFDGKIQVYGLRKKKTIGQTGTPTDKETCADCKADRDACMAGVGKPGNPTAGQCAQAFKACFKGCK